MAKQLSNKIEVPVIDQNGNEVDRPLELYNVPIAELFPNEPIVVIDWVAANDKRPDVETIKVPVPFDGQMYRGDLAWGSNVKMARTYGVTRDLLVEIGLLKEVERTIKTGRMLLGQGLYGGMVGKVTIKVVKEGIWFGGAMSADGQGAIRRSFAEAGYSGLDKIKLGRGKQSYQFWQRIPWSTALQAELKPRIDETLVDLASSNRWLMDHKDATWDEKRELVSIEAKMGLHPYVANALSRSSAEDIFRVATTVDVPCQVRVAVATDRVGKIAMTGKGAVCRYPIDSFGSIQSSNTNSKVAKSEEERISKLEVIQYTVSTMDMMANGTFVVVDDEDMPEGVDIVMCVKDIKMGSRRHGRRTVDGVVAFTQWFDKGCGIGLSPEWAKDNMGADFDGDLIFKYMLKQFPELYRVIAALPEQKTPKLDKSHTYISKNDRRAEMAVNSMCNIVGWATNLMSSTFAVADRERAARLLGYTSEARMDWTLNRLVKIGTDGFKTMAWDREKTEKALVFLQKNIQTALSKVAPWTHWKRSNWAFRRGIPEFFRKGMAMGVERRNSIPSFFDGTVAQICRITLPNLGSMLETPIEQKPLSAFRHWAMEVEDHLAGQAHELQMEYNGRVHRVNFQNTENVRTFRKWWQGRLNEWAKAEGISREMAASAMWREAHNTRSDEASGASVFIGFPEQSKWIVSEKPGWNKDKTETTLVGLHYVFDHPVEHLTADVEVREFKQIIKNKTVIRKIVCVHGVKGKKAPRAPYPADLLGMVERHAIQPEKGRYIAQIAASGHGKAWHCKLTSI